MAALGESVNETEGSSEGINNRAKGDGGNGEGKGAAATAEEDQEERRERADSCVDNAGSKAGGAAVAAAAGATKTPMSSLRLERKSSTDSASSLGWSNVPTPRLDGLGDMQSLGSIVVMSSSSGDIEDGGGVGCNRSSGFDDDDGGNGGGGSGGGDDDDVNDEDVEETDALLHDDFDLNSGLDGGTPFGLPVSGPGAILAAEQQLEQQLGAQPEDLEELRKMQLLDTPKPNITSASYSDAPTASATVPSPSSGERPLPPGWTMKYARASNKMVCELWVLWCAFAVAHFTPCGSSLFVSSFLYSP